MFYYLLGLLVACLLDDCYLWKLIRVLIMMVWIWACGYVFVVLIGTLLLWVVDCGWFHYDCLVN